MLPSSSLLLSVGVLAALLSALPPLAVCADPSYTHSASVQGRALAYVDFNADSLLDVLAVGANQSQLLLYLWQKEGSGGSTPPPTEVRLAFLPVGQLLVGAVAADFNGDSRADVLMTVKTTRGGLSVWIAYGVPGSDNIAQNVTEPRLVTQAVDQPTLLDFNADMVADFLVETSPGSRVVFAGRPNENLFDNYTNVLSVGKPAPLAVPNANLFTDMNGDLRADLVLRLAGGGDSAQTVAVFLRTDSGFQLGSDLPSPDGLSAADYAGQMVPVSLDNDEIEDLAMPTCERNSDGSCGASGLYLFYGAARKWCKILVDKKYAWHRQLYPTEQPVQLRAGDLDLDGRLDLLTTLRRVSDGATVAALLTPPSDAALTAAECDKTSVQLRELPLPGGCPDGLAIAESALADLNQDGGLDILLLCSSPSGDRWLSRFYSQQYNEEGYFFRSLVLNGMCPNAAGCPGRRLPVGLPVPGPCVRFSTERPQGGTRVGIGCQLSQTAYGQLDLPYLHFGLGQFSNYIDRLTVAIPYARTPPRQRDFTFIIPNSQLLVIPHPHDTPSAWTSELFVRPFYDKQVLFVGVTLLGTCLIACAVAAIFQCLEYRKDKLERVAGQQGVVFDPSSR